MTGIDSVGNWTREETPPKEAASGTTRHEAIDGLAVARRQFRQLAERGRQYLIDLTQTVIDHAGVGVVYWEPAWISTRCRTRWGRGSAWENAALFDFHHHDELLPGIDFYQYAYRWP